MDASADVLARLALVLRRVAQLGSHDPTLDPGGTKD